MFSKYNKETFVYSLCVWCISFVKTQFMFKTTLQYIIKVTGD